MEEKEFREKFTWECVGYKPTRWGLGVRNGQNLTNIVARCTRLHSGQWVWFTTFMDDPGNVEPSLDCAIQTAMQRVLENLDRVEIRQAYETA